MTNIVTEAAIELRELKTQERELASRMDVLKKIIRENTVIGEQIVDTNTGELLCHIRSGQARFNPDHAKEHLPSKVYTSILTLQPDKLLAKELLAPALYELCCTITDPMVIIK